MPYNPFDTPIGEALTAIDLQQLITRSVSEGYFVEYKGEMVSNEKIAKSVASFANTYGGWYFIGVKADKQQNIATNICGFDLSTCADPIATVREVVKTHVTPTPVFYPQVVSLSTNTVVLVIYIPGEQDTPFISKNGRIYRRVADSSDPVYEKDRYAVDRLVDQGQRNAKRFKRFCSDGRTFSESEKGGWLNIALSPYPPSLIDKRSILYPTENFERIFQRGKDQIGLFMGKELKFGEATLGFTSAQLTTRSIILRGVDPTQIAFNSATLELFIDGSAKIMLPFPHFDILAQGKLSSALRSSEVKKALLKFTDSSSNSSLYYAHFFNIGQLWKTMYVYLSFYLDWLSSDILLVPEFKVAISLKNTWRCVPFLDMDDWGTHVEQFGLPILLFDTISIPDEPGKGLILNVEDDGHNLWMELTNYIGLACGLTLNLTTGVIFNSLFDIQSIPPEWKAQWKAN